MKRSVMLAGLALLAISGPVLAQEVGGLGLDPGIGDGPHGLARPLPFLRNPYVTARDLQGTTSAADRQAQNQAMITKLRGDPGYLAGFSMGTPLAPSRQQQFGGMPDDSGYRYRRRHGRGDGLVIINEGNGPITIGDGNLVQQQTAITSGPVAQQQVSTTAPGSPGGGALNLVSRGGNIIQRSPGER
jgi:hypothetical protein